MRLSIHVGFVLLILAGGCRGRSYDDVYRQKLAQEIRVLEDQLYEADYQNRVLRDEVQRLKSSASSDGQVLRRGDMLPGTIIDTPQILDDRVVPMERDLEAGPKSPFEDDDYDVLDLDAEKNTSSGNGGGLPTPPDLDEQPLVDPDPREPSQPRSTVPESGLGMPREIPTPQPDPSNSDAGMGMPDLPGSIPDSSSADPEDGTGAGPSMPLPPPRLRPESIPPGSGEPIRGNPLLDENIRPGEPKPPADDPNGIPGKIELEGGRTLQFDPLEIGTPDDASTLSVELEPAVPTRIELNESLSGTDESEDGDADGLGLVVTATDESGRLIALENFDVDANLSVVLIDPLDDSDDPRVGRWDFSPEQVRSFVKSSPVSGLHIPIRWQDRKPTGRSLHVYVRLSAAEEEMRCEGRVLMKPQVARSTWLPR